MGGRLHGCLLRRLFPGGAADAARFGASRAAETAWAGAGDWRLGLLSIALIHNQYLLLLPMAAFGIAWASIIAMPYAILSISLPSERMGVYMGIFNFFIVLPQIAYSLFMPFIIKNVFHEDALKTIILGAACFLIAAILATRVVEVAPASAIEPTTR